MVLRKRRQLALEYRRKKWREAARERREREREARGDSGWVRGQNGPAYEPTPEERGQKEPAYEPTLEEIRQHCAEIRPERQDFVPKVYSLDVIHEAIERSSDV